MGNVPRISRETLLGVLVGVGMLAGIRAAFWLGCKLLGVL